MTTIRCYTDSGFSEIKFQTELATSHRTVERLPPEGTPTTFANDNRIGAQIGAQAKGEPCLD